MNNGVCIMYAFNQRVSVDGRRRVDLIDRFGRLVRNAYVMSGVGFPLGVPLAQETDALDYSNYPQVVVGFMQGDPLPVVLGALDNNEVTYTRDTSTDTQYEKDVYGDERLADSADTDTDNTFFSMEEVVLAAPQGGRFVLKRNGHAVIAGVGISMQIPEGSYLRISAGGDTAGRVPLVDPLVKVIDDMAEKINALQDEVRALRAELTTGTSMVMSGVQYYPVMTATTPPTAIMALAKLNATAGLPVEETVLFPAVDTSTSEPLMPLDALTIASSTLRVSSATEV